MREEIFAKIESLESAQFGKMLIPEMRLLRWRACYYKYCRFMGFYSSGMDKKARFKLCNELL